MPGALLGEIFTYLIHPIMIEVFTQEHMRSEENYTVLKDAFFNVVLLDDYLTRNDDDLVVIIFKILATFFQTPLVSSIYSLCDRILSLLWRVTEFSSDHITARSYAFSTLSHFFRNMDNPDKVKEKVTLEEFYKKSLVSTPEMYYI